MATIQYGLTDVYCKNGLAGTLATFDVETTADGLYFGELRTTTSNISMAKTKAYNFAKGEEVMSVMFALKNIFNQGDTLKIMVEPGSGTTGRSLQLTAAYDESSSSFKLTSAGSTTFTSTSSYLDMVTSTITLIIPGTNRLIANPVRQIINSTISVSSYQSKWVLSFDPQMVAKKYALNARTSTSSDMGKTLYVGTVTVKDKLIPINRPIKDIVSEENTSVKLKKDGTIEIPALTLDKGASATSYLKTFNFVYPEAGIPCDLPVPFDFLILKG